MENIDTLGEGLRMTNRDVSPKTCHDFHLPSTGGRVRINNDVDAVPVSNQQVAEVSEDNSSLGAGGVWGVAAVGY